MDDNGNVGMYRVVKRIGGGTFCEAVMLGVHKLTQQTVALKFNVSITRPEFVCSIL